MKKREKIHFKTLLRISMTVPIFLCYQVQFYFTSITDEFHVHIFTLCRLVIHELKESRYFEGPEESKVFTHNLDLLEKRDYQMIGRIVALALLQDGPGLHFLNEIMYDLMVGETAADLENKKISMHGDLNQLTQEVSTSTLLKLQFK
jgi:hypothetical protein